MKTKAPTLTAAQKAQILGETLNSRIAGFADNPVTVNVTTLTRSTRVLSNLLDRAYRRQQKAGTGRPILIVTI